MIFEVNLTLSLNWLFLNTSMSLYSTITDAFMFSFSFISTVDDR